VVHKWIRTQIQGTEVTIFQTPTSVSQILRALYTFHLPIWGGAASNEDVGALAPILALKVAPSEDTDSTCSMCNTCQGVWACGCVRACALVSLRQSRFQGCSHDVKQFRVNDEVGGVHGVYVHV